MNKTRQCDECGKFRHVKWTDNVENCGWLCEDCAKSARIPVEELPIAAEILPDGRARLRYVDGSVRIVSAKEAAANPVRADSPYRTVRKDRLEALEQLYEWGKEYACMSPLYEHENPRYTPYRLDGRDMADLRRIVADLKRLETETES